MRLQRARRRGNCGELFRMSEAESVGTFKEEGR